MQLTTRAGRAVGALTALIALSLLAGREARGDDSKKDPDAVDSDDKPPSDTPTTDDAEKDDADKKKDDEKADKDAPKTGSEDRTPKIEDRAVKRASLEVAEYDDSDHVTVFSPSIAAGVENPELGASLNARYLVDVVSAASVDIVSTASRRWQEVRNAGSADATYKPHDFGISVAGSVSSEPDYLSYGVGSTITHDFDEKNLTLLFGYGYGHDTIGRSGTSFSVFSRTLERSAFTLGVTRVLSRSTFVAGGLDVFVENGDSSKPYRYIPMFSAADAAKVPEGASIQYVTEHRQPERPLEQLPLEHQRFAFTGRLGHRFDDSTLRLEERLYADNWGMKASTTDARWIFGAGRRVELWPHVRYHVQTPVDFWQRAYVTGAAPGWNLPEFRTGDRELGPLSTVTGGGGVKLMLGPDIDPRQWTISFSADAMYTQFTDDLYVTSRTAVIGVMTLETVQ